MRGLRLFVSLLRGRGIIKKRSYESVEFHPYSVKPYVSHKRYLVGYRRKRCGRRWRSFCRLEHTVWGSRQAGAMHQGRRERELEEKEIEEEENWKRRRRVIEEKTGRGEGD